MANQGVGNLGFGGSTGGGGGGGGITTITTAPARESVVPISGLAGTVQNAWTSFTFVIYSGTVLIDGQTFRKGTYSYSNLGGFLTNMPYDATGSTDAKIMVTQP